MSTAVIVTFSGLIAFVPINNPANSPLSAYLVKADDHTQVMRVEGTADLSQTGMCSKSGNEIKCDLAYTDIEIMNQDNGFMRILRRKVTDRKRPDLDIKHDKESMDWLVHMFGIQSGIGKVKSWSDLQRDKLVGGRLKSFGWINARVSDLDGTECGEDALALIGFHTGNTRSVLQQVVAEEFEFQVNVKVEQAQPLTIVLTNRANADDPPIRITSTCKPRCPEILFENTANSTVWGDGNHFLHYYDIVDRFGLKMIPVSLEREDCAKTKESEVSVSRLRRALERLRPTSSKEADLLLLRLAREPFGKKVKLQELIEANLAGYQKSFKDKTRKLLLKFLMLQDRPICPPVLLEP